MNLKPKVDPLCLYALWHVYNEFLRFTPGAMSADLPVSMVTQQASHPSTYTQFQVEVKKN